MSDCRKCAKFEECAVDEDCGLFVDKPMTNGDRIRTTSDAELAEWYGTHACCMAEPLVCRKPGDSCRKCWLDWLTQEVEK